MTDFAVRVKNLPTMPAYQNLEDLTAQLELHVKEVVDQEAPVLARKN